MPSIIISDDTRELLNKAHGKYLTENSNKKRPSDDKVIKKLIKVYLNG